ncbi:MAG: FecR domain-containing protein [Steroidobacteraceae bacterium]|nr:FecR domain-containing protein [Steroidobacteraceae bacterium]
MTPERSSIRAVTAAFALALAFAAGAAAAKEAGKALFVAGSVALERAPPVALAQGDAVQAGDTVATGDKSRAQILMNDGARVALRANSRWRVDEFALPATVGAATQATAVQAQGVSVTTLLKGGFRSSTGAIGKEGAGTYEVRTPIGTLGIRGTDYTAVWCQGDCADVPAAAPARNGMYLATHSGAIVFRYGNREAVVEAGQAIFIAAADALPEPLDQLPEWVAADGAGALETGQRADVGKGQAGLPDFSATHRPPEGPAPADSAPPDPPGPDGKAGLERPVRGTVNGQPVDLTRGTLDQRSPNNPPPGTPSLPPPSTNLPPPPANNPPPPGGG